MLKYTLAESFSHPQIFPSMKGGMWGLTAAQRALLLGKVDAKSDSKKKRKVKRYSMEELRTLERPEPKSEIAGEYAEAALLPAADLPPPSAQIEADPAGEP